MRKLATLLLVLTSALSFAKPQKISKQIKVDQFGYMIKMPKVAVIVDPQVGHDKKIDFNPGKTYEVRDYKTDKVIFSGQVEVWNNGATHEISGDKGWWFDFTSVETPGSYYVYDPTNKVGSYQFDISDDVYDVALKAALRMFYYNRCNFPKEKPYVDHEAFVDGPSFVGPFQDTECTSILKPDDKSTAKDLSGGWWDAGDYNKYTTFTQSTLSDLLNAYHFNPEIWTDDYNIPESGNGIPDIIDEIKYELDWLMKMQNKDGSGILKMGNLNHGIEDPIKATLPPGTDRRHRYYYPQKSSAAAIGLALDFAHAAYVFKNVKGMEKYAEELQRRAVLSFEWYQNNPKNDRIEYDNPQGKILIQAGAADRSLEEQEKLYGSAAFYLYALTGDKKYAEEVISKYWNSSAPVGNGWWGPYGRENGAAALLYASLPNADP